MLERFIHRPHKTDIVKIIYSKTDYSTPFLIYTKNGDRISCLKIYPYNKNFITTNTTKYLVYSHGNSSNIITQFNYFRELSNDLDTIIITYDYVGYSLSENKWPSENRCYDSIECVMDHLLVELQINPENIYLVGRSLGTGVVIDYLSKHPWTTPAILISPYKSIFTTKFRYNFLKVFDKFVSIDKIKNVKCPIKIFHGHNDNTISLCHSMELYELLPNKSLEPTLFDNTNHRNILGKIKVEDYLEVFNHKI